MSSSAGSIPQPRMPVSARKAKFALLGLFLLSAAIWMGPRNLLSTNFLPHWYCYVGNTRLLWTNVIADMLIAISYLAISGTLVWLVRRAGRDLPYPHFFWAFGLFIVSCGGTHFLEVITVWKPVYWLSATVKVVTAVASVSTAVVLAVAADDIVGFVRTAREAAARRGSEQFRALINAAPMAVVSDDLEGRVTVWNPAAERLFGWTAAEAIGQRPLITPPDLEKEWTYLREKTLAGEITQGFETLRLNRAGDQIPVSISAAPIVDESGRIVSTMRVIEDNRERKRIEQELQEKSETLSTVTQALNSYLEVGDWKIASHHLLLFAIDKTRSEYGFLGVVLEGSVLRVLAHSGAVWDAQLSREMYEQKMRQHASEGYFEIEQTHNLLGEVITKGETVVANSPKTDPRSGGLPAGHPPLDSLLGVPIFKGKEVVGLIAVANRPGGYTGQELRYLETMSQATGVLYDSYRQNLKRRALEEHQKLLESQVRQAQKMEVLGRLAGGVAHDFNNMLMVLGGCTELLGRSLPNDTPARIHLDQIQRTTEKAAAITKQLLAFSRKQVLEIRPMDLHEALAECESMLPRLLGSDVVLKFRHEAERPWILADPAQIEQVVANLAINARDAMPEGGELTITTRNTASLPEDGSESFPLPKEWVVLEVEDTGCGMDEKTRAQIFDPFFTTKPQGKGTGLGLSTVYGIVKQSGGHIRVETEPGEGTRFALYFPCLDSRPAATQASPAVSDTDKRRESTSILVIDDESALRHAIVEILRASGYVVFEAETADQALDIAQVATAKIDILLTDVVMPGLRGTELARRIEKIHPGIQVVYMSGYAEGLPETQIPSNSTFLQKPFRFATLLEQLKLIRRKN